MHNCLFYVKTSTALWDVLSAKYISTEVNYHYRAALSKKYSPNRLQPYTPSNLQKSTLTFQFLYFTTSCNIYFNSNHKHKNFKMSAPSTTGVLRADDYSVDDALRDVYQSIERENLSVKKSSDIKVGISTLIERDMDWRLQNLMIFRIFEKRHFYCKNIMKSGQFCDEIVNLKVCSEIIKFCFHQSITFPINMELSSKNTKEGHRK